MENSTNTDFDVLADLGTLESTISMQTPQETEITSPIAEEILISPVLEIEAEENGVEKKKGALHYLGFMIKYCFTCGFIFMLLLVSTNFNAYFNIAKGYVFSGELERNERGLINSVEAGNITDTNQQIEKVILKSRDEKYEKKVKELEKDEKVFHSIGKIASKAKSQDINLNIEIAPYENRIIIPKIGKNIPLLDVKNQEVDGLVELNNIFMKELEDGVVRYPGSAKPGETGNAFIFGHSSNFPWLEGDYKDVFATLHTLTYDDEVIVYYGQRKYTYKITTKEVVRPGDVSVLKRDKGISEITLMTCWPVGTTLNRMILIGELIEE